MPKIRNIAIIAHVDHGKTTLVDGLLKQSNTFRQNESLMSEELIMDSNDQEKERGITIFAKIASVYYEDTKINIIDTPGHSDFSGEVERTLNMAEGALLLIDAQEGPMPQTKFVLKKALELNLNIIVVINKIDKPNRRIDYVINKTTDLFLELATHESQLEFPIIYAVAREGKAWDHLPENLNEQANFEVIFENILHKIPEPNVTQEGNFQMLVSSLDWDSYKGRYAIGKVKRGTVTEGMKVAYINKDNNVNYSKVEKIYSYKGLNKVEISEPNTGDIIALTGIYDINIGDTICDIDKIEALPRINLEEPTLKLIIGANTSPFAGREGEFVTARQVLDRIKKELETNIALKFDINEKGEYVLSGRGELHIAVFLEKMRREGYEFQISKPQVILKEINGELLEPIEELTINVNTEFIGNIIQELGQRKGVLLSQVENTDKTTDLVFEIPTRGLLGFRNLALTLSKGTAVLSSIFSRYDKVGSFSTKLRRGALVSFDAGTSSSYALNNAQERGILFIGKSVQVYQGMVIGLNSRDEDLDISVTKEKKATNMRTHSHDDAIILTPARKLSLEEYMDTLEDDELLEITPKHIRLRKAILDPTKRFRAKRA